MVRGGLVHLKTDSRFLHEYTRAVCAANGLKVKVCTNDLYHSDIAVPDEVRQVQTFYESMFLEQGYNITYMAFEIDHEGAFVAPREPSEEERQAPGYDPVATVGRGVFDTEYWRGAEGPRLLFGHDSAETRRQKLKADDSAVASADPSAR